MRTFVALNLPAAVREELHAALEPVRARPLAVRWVEPHALHLTVKFLGDIEGVEVTRIDEALGTLASRHGPVQLDIGGFGGFPSLRRASVLWLGVTASDELAALQRDAELALARLGYGREQRPFRPHITVGRVRSGTKAVDVERLAGSVEYRTRVRVDSIDLMRSHTGGAGSRYEPLLRRALGAAQEP